MDTITALKSANTPHNTCVSRLRHNEMNIPGPVDLTAVFQCWENKINVFWTTVVYDHAMFVVREWPNDRSIIFFKIQKLRDKPSNFLTTNKFDAYINLFERIFSQIKYIVRNKKKIVYFFW